MATHMGRNRRCRGFMLIEIVVVIAIIIIIAAAYYGLIGKKNPGEKSLPGKAMDKAVDTTCQSNIRQLRMNIQMDMSGEEEPPSSLEAAAKGLGSQFTRCPTSGQPYSYDRKTGNVHCTTPGHEDY